MVAIKHKLTVTGEVWVGFFSAVVESTIRKKFIKTQSYFNIPF